MLIVAGPNHRSLLNSLEAHRPTGGFPCRTSRPFSDDDHGRLSGTSLTHQEFTMRSSRKLHRFRPTLAGELEPRAVPSMLGGPAAAAEVARRASAAAARQIQLSGRVSGNSLTDDSGIIADAPARIDLSGNGRVTPLRKVRLSGTLFDGGFKPPTSLRTTGTVTLTTARGSITLDLESVATVADGPLGQDEPFRYVIRSGTGAFRNASGEGTARLTIISMFPTEPGPGGPGERPPGPIAGRFALVFRPGS
jgi:hypothetical protein